MDNTGFKSVTEIHSAKFQRNRLLAYFKKHGSITTFQARYELDIVAPAPRVYELRHRFGVDIETSWIVAMNLGGGRHRIAKYLLNDAS